MDKLTVNVIKWCYYEDQSHQSEWHTIQYQYNLDYLNNHQIIDDDISMIANKFMMMTYFLANQFSLSETTNSNHVLNWFVIGISHLAM